MRQISFVLVFGILLLITGCNNQATSPDPNQNNIDDQQEIPTEVQELLNKYALSDQEIIIDDQPAYLDSIPYELIENCDIYAVTMLWGELFNDASPSSDTADWSGTLWVNGVAVVHVRDCIDFEEGQDSVLIHDNPTFAAWISKTSGDFDGLNFLVFLKRDIVYITPPVLTFETDLITLQFNFYQLVCLDAFYQVDNLNGVAIHARRLWYNTCPGGVIEGRWINEGSFSGHGTMSGYWMDHLGHPTGYLNGTFWTNDDFTREFSGSVSGLVTDQVIAEFHGTWYYDDIRMCPMCGEGHGIFQGTFVFLSNDRVGKIEGEFGDYSLPPDDQDMPFTGVWQLNCPWFDVDNSSLE